MSKKLNHSFKKLLEVVKKQENQKIVMDLLTSVIGLNISSILTCQIVSFQDVSEYQFSLIALKTVLNNGERLEVYLKLIHRSKIKETIFCYWCFLYEVEQKYKKIKNMSSSATTVDRVYISEMSKERFKNSIFLSMKNNKEGILKYGAEAHFIDFIHYLENQHSKSDSFHKWLTFFPEEKDKILFIGVKATRNISRSNIEIV